MIAPAARAAPRPGKSPDAGPTADGAAAPRFGVRWKGSRRRRRPRSADRLRSSDNPAPRASTPPAPRSEALQLRPRFRAAAR